MQKPGMRITMLATVSLIAVGPAMQARAQQVPAPKTDAGREPRAAHRALMTQKSEAKEHAMLAEIFPLPEAMGGREQRAEDPK